MQIRKLRAGVWRIQDSLEIDQAGGGDEEGDEGGLQEVSLILQVRMAGSSLHALRSWMGGTPVQAAEQWLVDSWLESHEAEILELLSGLGEPA